MPKIANTAELQTELQKLIHTAQEQQPSRTHLARELDALSQRVAAGEDNSFGNGYFEPPVKLRSLGRFSDSLRPSRVLSYKYFLDDKSWMITTKVTRVSVMVQDLKTLIRLGLLRIQCNEPGTLSFYFAADETHPFADKAE